MALQLHIASVDRTAYLVKGSLSVEWVALYRGSADFELVDRTTASPYVPAVGDDVWLTFQGTRYFGGVVTRISVKNRTRGRGRRTRVTVADYSTYATWRVLLNQSFDANTTSETILSTLVSQELAQYSVTFDAATPTGTAWAPITFDNRRLDEVFNDICTAEGWSWVISPTKVFYAGPLTASAPANFTSASAAHVVVGDVTWDQDRDDYANYIVVRVGPDGPLAKTESWVGDSASRKFYCVHVPLSAPSTARVKRGAGSWVEYPVAAYGTAGFTWTYCTPTNCPAGWDTTYYGLYHDPGDTVLSASDQLQATIDVQFPVTCMASSAEAATARRMKVFTAEDITHKTTGTALATAYLAKYSAAPKVVRIQTRTHGYAPGQQLTINLPAVGLASGTYSVRTVRGRDRVAVRDTVSAYYMLYDVECVATGALPPSWRDWFADLGSSGGGGSAAAAVAGTGGTTGLIVQGQGRAYLGGSRTVGQRTAANTYTDHAEYVDVILDSGALPATVKLNVLCWVPAGGGPTVTPRLRAGSGDWSNATTVGTGTAVSATTPTWQQILVTPRAGLWAYRLQVAGSDANTDVFCSGAVLEW